MREYHVDAAIFLLQGLADCKGRDEKKDSKIRGVRSSRLKAHQLTHHEDTSLNITSRSSRIRCHTVTCSMSVEVEGSDG